MRRRMGSFSTSLVENDVDQSRLWIETEMVGQRCQLVAHILMQHMPRSQANDRKEDGLQGLIRRNKHDPFIVLSAV